MAGSTQSLEPGRLRLSPAARPRIWSLDCLGVFSPGRMQITVSSWPRHCHSQRYAWRAQSTVLCVQRIGHGQAIVHCGHLQHMFIIVKIDNTETSHGANKNDPEPTSTISNCYSVVLYLPVCSSKHIVCVCVCVHYKNIQILYNINIVSDFSLIVFVSIFQCRQQLFKMKFHWLHNISLDHYKVRVNFLQM